MSQSFAIGISLAIATGCVIGASLVVQKKGLVDAHAANNAPQEGKKQDVEASAQPEDGIHGRSSTSNSIGAELHFNATYFVGLLLLACGEVCNFIAYGIYNVV